MALTLTDEDRGLIETLKEANVLQDIDTAKLDLSEGAIWSPKLQKLCMDPSIIHRASYKYKDCELRVQLINERGAKRLEAATSACGMRLDATTKLYEQQLEAVMKMLDTQVTAVTVQNEVILNALTDSCKKRMDAMTELHKPNRAGPIIIGIVAGVVGIGLGVGIGAMAWK